MVELDYVFVSGHKRLAGRGSVLDGAVERGGCKIKIQFMTGCSHPRLIFAILGCVTAEEELWLALSFVVHGIYALYTSKRVSSGVEKAIQDTMANERRRKMNMKKILTLCIVALMTIEAGGCGAGSSALGSAAADESVLAQSPESADGNEFGTLSREGYELQKIVILSRHNIRSPLSGKGSVLDTLTPYTWFNWSSSPSSLSLRGGTLETEMGQYFRKWLEKEGLFPEDYRPEADEVRIYANSKQRTIATANFFKTGLLPVADTEVEYHADYDAMDPVFEPKITFVTDEYIEAAKEQMQEIYENRIPDLTQDYALLADVIDVEESEDYQSGNFTGFSTEDTELILEEDKEPALMGSLKTACSVSDAMVLQYFEAGAEEAAFGKSLTAEQWASISEIKDIYEDVLFTAPLVAANVANPLLEEIQSELGVENRKFTFLCGHDSNIASVLASLGATDYELSATVERKTPIGGKLVFGRWADADGKEYISVDMVYQTTEQLQNVSLLDLENPPMSETVALDGLLANEQGLYAAAEVEARIRQAIDEYDEICGEYAMDAAA